MRQEWLIENGASCAICRADGRREDGGSIEGCNGRMDRRSCADEISVERGSAMFGETRRR